MTAFVAVHGVGHFRSALSPADIVAARSAVWAKDLAAGLGTADKHVPVTYAYYAHHLHHGRPVAQGSEDLDRLEREHPHLAEDITHWAESLDESLGLRLPPPATAQGRLAVPLRQLVSAISERLSLDGRLTRAFIATFFRDVARYLGGPDDAARAAAREEVAGVISSTGARVVIAHSLGSVVAYEALHAHPELEVDLLLTLGSPSHSATESSTACHQLRLPAPANGLQGCTGGSTCPITGTSSPSLAPSSGASRRSISISRTASPPSTSIEWPPIYGPLSWPRRWRRTSSKTPMYADPTPTEPRVGDHAPAGHASGPRRRDPSEASEPHWGFTANTEHARSLSAHEANPSADGNDCVR